MVTSVCVHVCVHVCVCVCVCVGGWGYLKPETDQTHGDLCVCACVCACVCVRVCACVWVGRVT